MKIEQKELEVIKMLEIAYFESFVHKVIESSGGTIENPTHSMSILVSKEHSYLAIKNMARQVALIIHEINEWKSIQMSCIKSDLITEVRYDFIIKIA